MKSKKEFRLHVEAERAALLPEVKKALDEKILEKLLKEESYRCARSIFVYVSYKNEVDTHNIITDALARGKVVCVPKVISLKEGMAAVRLESFEELRKGPYGILEPELLPERIVKPSDMDLLIMPGVAFDLKGGRIGYGGGFYDRFLKEVDGSVPKIALAYSFQVFESVPMEESDMRIDKVITE